MVVGIGASAGGLEAITGLFERATVGSGIAYIVVQHLSPDFRSMMGELLARHTNLHIQTLANQTILEPDTIYLNSPRMDVVVQDQGIVKLEPVQDSNAIHLPVDRMLASLAVHWGPMAAGVILSGSGADGAHGIRVLKAHGGLTIAQQPDTAEFVSMPEASIATGVIDQVLPPERIIERLLSYLDGPRKSRLPRETDADDDDVHAIFQRLHEAHGLDFSCYAPTTIIRRLERRVQIRQMTTIADYRALVEGDPQELAQLYDDMLIGVTGFFRDREAFQRLEATVLPTLAKSWPEGREFRAWVAGCATGEEAYSVAMLLDRFNARTQAFSGLRVFATDVHRKALRAAAEGVFDDSAVTSLTSAEIETWFQRDQERLRIAPRIRDTLVFAPHDLLRDAPFTQLGLISCRNLLIYLDDEAQRRVLSSFDHALEPGGVLFLGPSETLGALRSRYDIIDAKWNQFLKREASTTPLRPRLRVRLPRDLRFQEGSGPGSESPAAKPMVVNQAYDALLARYAPSALLVDDRGTLLHVFGDSGKLLRFASGRPTGDILTFVPPELVSPLRAAMHRALANDERVAYRAASTNGDTHAPRVDIDVMPLPGAGGGQRFLLVTLGEAPAAPDDAQPALATSAIADQDQVAVLQSELAHARRNLEVALADADASAEALQATNEELLASNEELQSTNEELQSANEELYSVSVEYKSKIDELVQLWSDMEYLMRNAQIGVVFLDRELRIRRVTPTAAARLKISPRDIGRPLAAIPTLDWSIDLPELARRGLSGEESAEYRARLGGRDLLVRAFPYEIASSIEGAVISFVDITALVSTENELQQAQREYERLYHAAPDMYCSVDAQTGHVIRCNRRLVEKTGFDAEEIIGHHVLERYAERSLEGAQRAFQSFKTKGRVTNAELALRKKDGGEIDVLLNVTTVFGDDGQPLHSLSSWRDVSDERRVAEKLASTSEKLDIYRLLVDHMPLGTVIGEVEDANDIGSLRFFSVNAAATRASRTTPSTFLNKTLKDDFPAVIESGLAAQYQRALDTGEVQQLPRMEYAGDPGIAPGVFEVHAVPLGPRHLAVQYANVTEQTLTQRELESALAKLAERTEALERSNGELEQFAYIASHDLQEPLRMVSGYLQLLARHVRDSLGDEAISYLETAKDGAARMGSLIDDLLAYSRLTDQQESPPTVALGPVVEAAVKPLQGQIDELEARVEVGEMPTVVGHPVRLQQVFFNLIGNALKFRSDQPPRVRVFAEPDGEWWHVGVSDNGIGIDQESRSVIFEPFRRLHRADDVPGNGIGLSVVRRIITQYGGRVWVEAVEPHGSAFHLTLRRGHAVA